MSLFERIKNKRYDLQEIKKKGGPNYTGRVNFNKDNKNTDNPREKRFKQSFGTPTGADPKTGKPVYNPSYTIDAKGKKKLGPDIELPRSRTGGVPQPDKEGVSGYDRASKTLGDREAAKKTYLDPKTGKASDEGIKQYIKKARQMKTGSNIPVDDREVDTIYKSAKKEYADKINQKYGGRRATLKNTKPRKNVKTFKNFVSKGLSKAKKFYKKMPLKGKAAVIGGIAVGGALIGNEIRKALIPGRLTRKDFSPTKAITDTKGKKIRFKYDTYNPATKSTTSAPNQAGPTITKSQLGKFERGEYNVKDQSGKKIDLNKRIQQSAFTKQLKDASKGTGFFGRQTKKDQKFLQKYKKAAEYRGIKVK